MQSRRPTGLVSTPARDGAFDWFAFDLVSQTRTPPAKPPTKNPSLTVIPTHVRFRGMPNAKWWDFENNITDFGGIEVYTEDVFDGLDDGFALLFARADVWIEAGFDHGFFHNDPLLAGVSVELKAGVAMVLGHDFDEGAAEGEEGL